MKIPILRTENGTPIWRVDQESDRGFVVQATRNIHFDKRGIASLANRTINFFDTNDAAGFEVPIAFYITSGRLEKIAPNDDVPYSVDINDASPTISQDAIANQPSLSLNSSGVMYNGEWFVSETADLNSFDGSAWTDESVSITSGVRHPLAVHQGNNSLMVGNGPQVKQYNTSISETTNLTIPGDVEVVGIAYNRNLAAVVTWNSEGQEAFLYIWDGATAAANYAYSLGSGRAYFIVPWMDTFATLTGLGELLQWTNTGLTRLAALPCFYTSAILADLNDRVDVAYDTSVLVDGERILFNIVGIVDSKGSEPYDYFGNQPSGIWCYDKDVGLYHRHAPASAKLLKKTVATAAVDVSTNIITSTNVPATGTPFVYAGTSATIDPLVINTLYYVIQLSSTTFKAATSRANALAGTAVDLTAVTAASNFSFLFFPEEDFGQLAADSVGGVLGKLGAQEANTSESNFTIFEKYGYGAGALPYHFVSGADVDSFGVVMDRSENRGWIKFQKFYAENLTDAIQKLYVRARHIWTEHDKVLVKYRTSETEDKNMPIVARTSATVGTWVSATQFTTPCDLTNVKAALDADPLAKYQIEFIYGAGAGYLAHIESLSESGGTWTVNIDETIRNIAASDTCYFRIDEYRKLLTAENAAAITSASNPDYTEFPIAKAGKWVQFMVELRGHPGVALEELEIPNIGLKPGI